MSPTTLSDSQTGELNQGGSARADPTSPCQAPEGAVYVAGHVAGSLIYLNNQFGENRDLALFLDQLRKSR